MKKKLKILQIIGIFLMSLVILRAELLDLLKIVDFKYCYFWNTLFFTGLLFFLLYPLSIIFNHIYENKEMFSIKIMFISIKEWINK